MASVTVRMVVLVCAVGLLAPAMAQSDSANIPPAAQNATSQGDQLARAGNLQGAKQAYQRALKIAPDYALAHNQLGTVEYKLGDRAGAIREFTAAAKADPTYANAWYNLAYAAGAAHSWTVAVDAYRHYLKLQPDDADARYGLAKALDSAGDAAAAATAYDDYAAHEHRANEQGQAAQARSRANALRAQLAAASRPKPAPQPAATPAATPAPTRPAPATQPASPTEEKQNLADGDARMKAKDYTGAVNDYAAAVHLAPNDALAHGKLGYAYAMVGDLEKAIGEWQEVLRIDPSNAAAKKDIAVAKKRLAAEQAKAAPAPAPQAPAPAPQGPSPAARAAARKAYATGVGLINARKYGAAVEDLTQAVTDDPTLAVAWIARGSAYVGLRRYRAAIQDYARGHQLAPQMASPLFGLGEAHRALGENAQAARFYTEYANSRASDADAHLQSIARQWAARLR